MSTLTENIIVNSSAIHNAVYQHVTNELSITFKSGLTYEYYNVPSHIFDLADKIASIVLESLIKKQQEWDDQVQEDLNKLNNIEFNYVSSNSNLNYIEKNSFTEEEFIENKIIDLRKDRLDAVNNENYLLASKINNEIIELKKKIE